MKSMSFVGGSVFVALLALVVCFGEQPAQGGIVVDVVTAPVRGAVAVVRHHRAKVACHAEAEAASCHAKVAVESSCHAKRVKAESCHAKAKAESCHARVKAESCHAAKAPRASCHAAPTVTACHGS